jgi:hypothetical protein
VPVFRSHQRETVGGLVGDNVWFFFLALVGEVLSSLLSAGLARSSCSVGVGEMLLGGSSIIGSSEVSTGAKSSGPTSISLLEALESILDTSIFSSLKREYRFEGVRGLLLRVEVWLGPRWRLCVGVGISEAVYNGYRGGIMWRIGEVLVGCVAGGVCD